MKQVLIWDKYVTLKNSGGPQGYLYNIKEYLKEYPSNVIKFYSDLVNQQGSDINMQPPKTNSCVKKN